MEWETNIIGRETRRNWAFPTKQIFKGAIVGRRYPSGVTHGIANRHLQSGTNKGKPHSAGAEGIHRGRRLPVFHEGRQTGKHSTSSLSISTTRPLLVPSSCLGTWPLCGRTRSVRGDIKPEASISPSLSPSCSITAREDGTEGRCGNFSWKTPLKVCIPDFSMLVCNLAELSEEKLRANLTDNAMLLLLQILLLKHPVEQIARIFLLLYFAMNREVMGTIRLFLNYVQQTNPDITKSHIKQSIKEIAMQECITDPMKSFEEYWFSEFYNRERKLGKRKEKLMACALQ